MNNLPKDFEALHPCGRLLVRCGYMPVP